MIFIKTYRKYKKSGANFTFLGITIVIKHIMKKRVLDICTVKFISENERFGYSNRTKGLLKLIMVKSYSYC